MWLILPLLIYPSLVPATLICSEPECDKENECDKWLNCCSSDEQVVTCPDFNCFDSNRRCISLVNQCLVSLSDCQMGWKTVHHFAEDYRQKKGPAFGFFILYLRLRSPLAMRPFTELNGITGNEFLGKRNSPNEKLHNDNDYSSFDNIQAGQTNSFDHNKRNDLISHKTILDENANFGNEFIGKRLELSTYPKRLRSSQFLQKPLAYVFKSGRRSNVLSGKRVYGNEFLGKRSMLNNNKTMIYLPNDSFQKNYFSDKASNELYARTLVENEELKKKGSEFLGKRGSEFIGKRGSEFLGKRGSEFIGKRGSEFIGKRGSEFIGKRGSEFIGKRGSEFIGKRGAEFIGKRGNEFVGKRGSEFIGKRGNEFIGKRGNEFIGKRGSEFIGKRNPIQNIDFFDQIYWKHLGGQESKFQTPNQFHKNNENNQSHLLYKIRNQEEHPLVDKTIRKRSTEIGIPLKSLLKMNNIEGICKYLLTLKYFWLANSTELTTMFNQCLDDYYERRDFGQALKNKCILNKCTENADDQVSSVDLSKHLTNDFHNKLSSKQIKIGDIEYPSYIDFSE